MLRETSQSLPKTKLSPNVLNDVLDWPIRRMKKYAISIRISAASALSPHFSTRSGRRPSGDRSRTERPPLAVVALASTTRLLRDRRAVADHLRQLRVVLAVTSDAGSGAYGSWLEPAPSVFCPAPNAYVRNFFSAAAVPRARAAVLARVLVGDQERLRHDRVRRGFGELIVEIPRFGGTVTPAAAAEVLAIVGSTYGPAEFLTAAYVKPFSSAYACST